MAAAASPPHQGGSSDQRHSGANSRTRGRIATSDSMTADRVPAGRFSNGNAQRCRVVVLRPPTGGDQSTGVDDPGMHQKLQIT